jgi:hypothetical protein
MASTRLAEAIGYPGSSVAFAQLLSGMERSGLIEREVRGKRTYRIYLSAGAAAEAVAGGTLAAKATEASTEGHRKARVPARRKAAGTPTPVGTGQGAARARDTEQDTDTAVPGGSQGDAHGDFDYDELARRLLVQVVRRLAAQPTADDGQGTSAATQDDTTLAQTVAGLEQELASAWTMHGTLTAENVKLREQLRAAQRSLAFAEDRANRHPITQHLDSAEVVLLERLLSAENPNPRRDASAG